MRGKDQERRPGSEAGGAARPDDPRGHDLGSKGAARGGGLRPGTRPQLELLPPAQQWGTSASKLSDCWEPNALRTSSWFFAIPAIRRRARPQQTVLRTGDSARMLYGVHSGVLKYSRVSPDGEPEVLGFGFPGDVAGIEGLGDGVQPVDVVALTEARLCAVSVEQALHAARNSRACLHGLLQMLSNALARRRPLFLGIIGHSAEERVAFMLLYTAVRLGTALTHGVRLYLPMTRAELGNFLGLAPETTSRVFRHFADRGWLRAQGRAITLLAPDSLQALAFGRVRHVGPNNHAPA